MRDDIKAQMAKVKRECFALSKILGYDRIELKYTKQRHFNDDGVLDLYNITHFISS